MAHQVEYREIRLGETAHDLSSRRIRQRAEQAAQLTLVQHRLTHNQEVICQFWGCATRTGATRSRERALSCDKERESRAERQAPSANYLTNRLKPCTEIHLHLIGPTGLADRQGHRPGRRRPA